MFVVSANAYYSWLKEFMKAGKVPLKGEGATRAIQSLSFAMDLDKATIMTLDSFRQLRNTSDGDQADTVSKKQAQEMLELAIELRLKLEQWLCNHYPTLLSRTP